MSTISSMLFLFSLILLAFILILNSAIRVETSASDCDPEDNLNQNTNIKFKISEIEKKQFMEHVKKNFLKILGVKNAPNKLSSNKVVIPHDMLKLYKDMREAAISVIPDDNEYFGKIMDHMSETHGSIWNKRDNMGIEIDMNSGQKKIGSRTKRYYNKGAADTVTCLIPLDNITTVPDSLERILPPRSRGKTDKVFMSVHLKFNISENVLLPKVEELKGAELRLTRELPPVVNRLDENISSFRYALNHDKTSTNNESYMINSIQMVYVIQIVGYDNNDIPITRIVDSKRINTTETTTLVFDVYEIVKHWLTNRKKNYGLIIRVTDDRNQDSSSMQAHTSYNSSKVIEHVRISPQFGQESDSMESWAHKQPIIMVYTGDPKLDQPYDVPLVRMKRETTFVTDSPGLSAINSDPSNQRQFHSSHNPMTGIGQHSQRSQGPRAKSSQPRATSRNTQTVSNSNPNTLKRGNSSVANSNNFKHNNNNQQQQQQQQQQQSQPNRNQVKKPTKVKCAVRNLSINFGDVGWNDWIIAPHSYYANYCAGDCSYPLGDHENATNHAIIQSIFHSVGRVIPKSCCVPTKLSSMAILFSIDGLVQLKNYNDMIVEACGCL